MTCSAVSLRTIALGAALAAAAAGCASNGEPLTPDTGVPAGGAVYVLRTVAGAAVPAVWIWNAGVTVTVLADTLRLRAQGRGERVLVEEYLEATPALSSRRREAGALEYARWSDRIEISLPCNDQILALCIAPPHFVGRVTADALVFEQALSYATPLRYERVRD